MQALKVKRKRRPQMSKPTFHLSGGQPLRPRARILRTLGEELISSETVAVIELVKNAYDADARVVLVHFIGKMKKGQGSLEISDDGHGMNISTVRSAWMEPATSVKKQLRRSTFLNRRLLGEKGVGRFASARLAEELELITRAPAADKEIFAVFDWTQFDRDDLYLDEVLIIAHERKPTEFVKGRPSPAKATRIRGDLPRDGTHGTLLRMNHLKRDWSVTETDDLRRGLSRLVSPFDGDHNFRIFLQLPNEAVGTAQEVEPPKVIEYPHYSLDGAVAEDGKYTLTLSNHAGDKVESRNGWFRRHTFEGRTSVIATNNRDDLGDSEPITCGKFDFRVLVWDRDQLDNIDQKLGVGIRSIRKDLDSLAGISIYRDSFRVLPYGEPDNDWLRLDMRRVQNPTLRLSNNQITGFIRISADSNPALKDQSNREGLDDNQAFFDLQAIILLSLAELEAMRFQHRRTGSKSGDAQIGGLLDTPDLAPLRKKLAALRPDAATLRLFDDATKQWEGQVLRIREVLSRYHSLATLGQLVDKVVHDSRQPLSTIQGQASLAREFVGDWVQRKSLGNECREALSALALRLDRIKEAGALIDIVLRRIEPLGGRRRGKPTKVYIEQIIRGAFTHFAHEISALGVKVTLPKDTNVVTVDAAELQEVLINLLSNSLYWLSQVAKDRRAIVVECSRPKPSEIAIVFADSGPGVPTANRNSIFEPYFSTKPDGVGLGLVIAGEIIRDFYDGSLELLNSGPLPGAVFRILLRKRV